MARKTVDVDYLKNYANAILAGSDPDQKNVRRGVMLLLEETLMRSGNFKGFKYLSWNDKTKKIEDETRVQYF